MRVLEVAAVIAIAFLLQTIGGRYLTPLHSYMDLFLVVAAGFGLVRGRMAGLAAGTVGGLVQDAFSGGILGLNGLSKSTVGYLAGVVCRWLIIRGWAARFLFFFVASMADLAILALVGLAAERPIVMGEGITALIVCTVNALIGTLGLGFLDRRK